VNATPDLTERIARMAREVTASDMPAHGREVLKSAVFDYLVCALAGSRTDTAKIVIDWVRRSGNDGTAQIIGTDICAAPALAALANGVSGHSLDYDDVSVRMTHPTVTIAPGVWALAQHGGHTGAAVMDAYLAGFEVEARLCRVLNPGHYEAGWHTTGTLGVFGSAAAACRLLDLDVDRTRSAFGIAASAAAGIRRNAGSMVKPLHAGQASFHGVQAAELAAAGFRGNPSAFTGSSGFLEVFGVDGAHDELLAAFESPAPYEIVEGGIAFKRFACCGAIHTAIDALLELVAENGVKPDDVVSIDAHVNRLVPGVLTHHVTSNALEGKFSLEYSLAVALVDRAAGLEQYTQLRAADPKLIPYMERVNVVVDQELPVNQAYFASEVVIERRAGEPLRRRVDIARGYPQVPLSREELVAKGRGCATGIISTSAYERLVELVFDLEHVADVSEIVSLL